MGDSWSCDIDRKELELWDGRGKGRQCTQDIGVTRTL